MERLQTEVDERLERVFDGLSSLNKTWTPEERSKFCDEQGEHPLFAGGEEPAPNSTVAAMHNVEYDELDSPIVLATEFKEKGNAAFKAGSKFYGNAVRHYKDALRHAGVAVKMGGGGGGGGGGCGGGEEEVAEGVASTKALRELISTCHSNLAAVYLARKKYISVLEECQAALRAWPDNAKAAWRAVKAALALGKATTALELAELGGLSGDSSSEASFAPLVKEARELLALQVRTAEATAREMAGKEESLAQVRLACKERGISVGPPLFSGMRRTLAQPFVEAATGTLHFPLVLLYPAVGQSDFVEDWAEDEGLGGMVECVLPNTGPPPPWDARGEYRAANCDIFYKSNPCKPIPIESAWTSAAVEEAPEESWKDVRWVLCPPSAPLLLALAQPSYVVADLPVFYVVPRGSAFWEAMRSAAGGGFVQLVVPKELLVSGQ